jgi:tetratricopeptide (TPR) repeat protein
MNKAKRPARVQEGTMRRLNTQGAWLGLACLLPIAATGCQSVSHRVSPKSFDSPSELKGSSVGEKTEFHRDVGAGQEVSVHIDLARALETQGNFEGAVAQYQKAIEACDGSSAHRLGGRIPAAQRALAHRRMAGALDRLGRFAQAETHYREAMKLSPNDVNVWNDVGYSYYLQRRWPEAERSLLQAAKLDPDNQRVQTNLGLAQAGAGKTDAALDSLTRASGPAVAHANLGYILAATGKTDEARKHYQAALDYQPQFEAARYALARLDAGHTPQGPGTPRMISSPAVASALPVAPTPTSSATVVVPTSLSSAATSAPFPPVASAPIVVPTPIATGSSYASSPLAAPAPIVAPAPMATGEVSASSPTPAFVPQPIATPASVSAYPVATSDPVVLTTAPTPAVLSPARPALTAAATPPRPVLSAPPGAPRPQLAVATPAAPRPVVHTINTRPATSLDASQPIGGEANSHARPGLGDFAPIEPPQALASTMPPVTGGRPDPGLASASTGIPLPARLLPPQPTSTDQDLSRASADTGIPLPVGRPAPAPTSMP